MRLFLIIYLLTLSHFSFCQEPELVEVEMETFYKVFEDSINLKQNYPDGRYKVFLSDTNRFPKHVFFLRNGNVDGPYLKLTSGGWTYGTYSEDSLWTFLTAPKDTTYKTGTWRHHIYTLGYSTTNVYKTPFDKNGIFIEVWRFHNGQKAREAIIRKGFGLEKETYWDFETNKISKQIINSGTVNYYQSITYENDSISNATFIQNGIETNIAFNHSYYTKKPSVKVDVYDENREIDHLPIAAMTIDSSLSVTNFNDLKNKVFIRSYSNGEIILEHLNKNGKSKYKKIKK
jgi:hypothetical protein